jgi:hypothetical protein
MNQPGERAMILRTRRNAMESPPAPAVAEQAAAGLQGHYHDVLTGPKGEVIWDRGWSRNTITADCKRLLAGLLHGGGGVGLGVQGIQIGQGLPAWDQGSTPAPQPTQTKLVDPNPYLAPLSALQIDYLDGGNVTATPTNRLQIKATLGPGVPPWPDANHAVANLREFGLYGSLAGTNVLINYVTHPVIVKDPSSTLTRTVWLVF